MNITYCRKCNHFYPSHRINNYCRSCKSPTITVDMDYAQYSALSLNDRYRLSYELTKEYDSKFRS